MRFKNVSSTSKPLSTPFASTPLTGKVQRVAAPNADDNEEKEKVTVTLAPTSLSATPTRFKNVASPSKAPAALLASTPLRGAPQRVTTGNSDGEEFDESAFLPPPPTKSTKEQTAKSKVSVSESRSGQLQPCT